MNYTFKYGEDTFSVSINQQNEKNIAIVNGDMYEFEIIKQESGLVTILLGNNVYTFHTAGVGTKRWIAFNGCTYFIEKPNLAFNFQKDDLTSDNILRAPMPAQVRKVQIQANEVVNAGESLMILEAMKMEIRIQATKSGRIHKIYVEEGQAVDRDELLIELEDVDDDR